MFVLNWPLFAGWGCWHHRPVSADTTRADPTTRPWPWHPFLFGIGWGLGGYCPGPGIVAASSGALAAVVFLIGMTTGIFVENAVARRGGSS